MRGMVVGEGGRSTGVLLYSECGHRVAALEWCAFGESLRYHTEGKENVGHITDTRLSPQQPLLPQIKDLEEIVVGTRLQTHRVMMIICLHVNRYSDMLLHV